MLEFPEYYRKQEKPLYAELMWNIPEQKQGKIAIVGGNAQNFSIVNRMMGAAGEFPFSEVRAVMPDALRGKVPLVPEILLCPSTESGSFRRSYELEKAVSSADFSLLIGDFSKNSETATAVFSALKKSEKPAVITRDTVDLISSEMTELTEKKLIIMGSMAQLQKMLRAMYYPKVLLLSMPLLPVVEVLHKFTLSYPWGIVTLHQGVVLVAYGGDVVGTKLEMTGFSPMSLWDGRAAMRILGNNLYNPSKTLEATAGALVG